MSLCDWCTYYYSNDTCLEKCNNLCEHLKLCSWCNDGKKKGYTKADKNKITEMKYQERRDKQKKIEEEIYESLKSKIIDYGIFIGVKKMVDKISNATSPDEMNSYFFDILNKHNKYFSYSQGLELYKSINPYDQELQKKYQHIICSKILDYWNIDDKEMPEGYCYYSFVVGKPYHCGDVKYPKKIPLSLE